MTPTEITVDSGGVSIAVRDFGGDGPAILLIPGGGRNVCDWDEVAKRLTAYRVVAMDKRGHGLSDIVETWDWDAAVGDVSAVVGALGLQDSVICGHSMGGMLACSYFADHQTHPGAINLDGSGQTLPSRWPGWDAETDGDPVAYFHELNDTSLDEMRDNEGGQSDDEVQKELDAIRGWAEKTGISADMMEAGARRGARTRDDGKTYGTPTPAKMAAYMDAVGRRDMFEIYRRIDGPLLLIVSTTADDESDPKTAKWLAAHRAGMELDYADLLASKPKARLESIDGTHMLNLEAPDATAAALARFVDEVNP